MPLLFIALMQPRGVETLRGLILEELGIKRADINGIAAWVAKLGRSRSAKLSDTELCLLSCLIPTDGEVPVGRSPEEIQSWLEQVFVKAAEIKSIIRQPARTTGAPSP
jgi:hypothetical protein